MTTPDTPAAEPGRKPRLALMGEFSAGKSTLANLMLGRPAIPVQVTATHLPPVWLTLGGGAPSREDLAGARHPLPEGGLAGVPVDDTAFLRLEVEADVLAACDLIDTPGLSDPDMPGEAWERAAALADGVLWLTHATQAWRQSEAAAWERLPERLRAHSLLVVTRFDKLTTAADRARVLARLERETAGLFRGIVPISLTGALAARDDAGAWADSGGAAFAEAVHALLTDLRRALSLADPGVVRRLAPDAARAASVAPVVPGTAPPGQRVWPPRAPDTAPTPAVVPRRVSVVAGGGPARVLRPRP